MENDLVEYTEGYAVVTKRKFTQGNVVENRLSGLQYRVVSNYKSKNSDGEVVDMIFAVGHMGVEFGRGINCPADMFDFISEV